MTGARYDVFISFNSTDRVQAKKIGASLNQRGLSVFIDRWRLSPGKPWAPELEDTLASCGAVIVLLGRSGMGRWQQNEAYLALDRNATDRDFPVIPLLLPGNEDPPVGFLSLHTWIDMSSCGVGDTTSIDRLVQAIKDYKSSNNVPDVSAEICPFRGLSPFREEDHPFFFGRDEEIERLHKQVIAHPIVSVVGRSGSGKSSLVYAGLLPRLRGGIKSELWEFLTLRPGRYPLHNLMRTIAPPDKGSPAARDAQVDSDVELLRQSKVKLSRLVEPFTRLDNRQRKLLIFVDQWEELYSQDGIQSERSTDQELFIDALIEATSVANCRLVFTIRADFYQDVLKHGPLTEHVESGRVDLGPLTQAAIKASIVKPAKKVGLSYRDRLDDQLLDDLGTEPGCLPLLEHVLSELWQKRDGRTLTHESYRALGGVKGALNSRAEKEFQLFRQKGEEMAQAFRSVMVSLVHPGEGRADTRTLIAMPDDVRRKEVIHRLSRAECRLLSTGSSAVGDRPVVEISHEALIGKWGTLQTWVEKNREHLRTRGRIAQARERWMEKGRSVEYLLPAGRQLVEAQDLLKNHGDVIIDEVTDYIAVSQQHEAERDKKRKFKRRFRLFLVAGGGTFALIVFMLFRQAEHDKEKLRFAIRDRTVLDLLGPNSRKLTELGDTEGLRVVNELALKYFDIVGADESETNYVRLQGWIKMQEGDILYLEGNYRAAMNPYKQAVMIFEELAGEHPQAVDIQSDLAVSYNYVGNVFLHIGSFDEVMESYRKGHYILLSQREVKPDSTDLLNELAVSQSALAIVHTLKGNKGEARQFLLDAYKNRLALVSKDPENRKWQKELAKTRLDLADFHLSESKYEKAEDECRVSLATAEKLALGRPNDLEAQSDIANSCAKLGKVLKVHGKKELAHKEFLRATQIRDSVVNRDTNSLKRKFDRAVSRSLLAGSHSSMGRANVALEMYAEAESELRRLVDKHPENSKWQLARSINRFRQGLIHEKEAELDAAREAFEEAYEIVKQLQRNNQLPAREAEGIRKIEDALGRTSPKREDLR